MCSKRKHPRTSRQIKKMDEWFKAKRDEAEKYQLYRMKLHGDYTDGIISCEDYIAFCKRYDLKAQNAGEAIFSLEQEIDQLVDGKSEEQKWIAYFKRYQDIEELIL